MDTLLKVRGTVKKIYSEYETPVRIIIKFIFYLLTLNYITAQLGYYNEAMEFVVEPGQLDIMVGTSSEDLPLKDTVTLTGKKNNVAGRRSYTCQVEEA